MYVKIIKKAILKVWFVLYDVGMLIYEYYLSIKDMIYCIFTKRPTVIGIEDTLNYIIDHKCSVSRYGDGELKFVINTETWFQKANDDLKNALATGLHSKDPNLIVCIPDIFQDLSIYEQSHFDYWKKYIVRHRRDWYNAIDENKIYYNAFISRCYLPFIDKSQSMKYFELWKRIWDKRDLVVVEGEKTRFGVGNTLFDNAKSIKRILGPNTGAFEHYNELISQVWTCPKDSLILIALGPTATVMAEELSKEGYQAIDIGHLDIEYEWMRLGTDCKVPIDGKFVNEAGAGRGVGECKDAEYQSQIIYQVKNMNCDGNK